MQGGGQIGKKMERDAGREGAREGDGEREGEGGRTDRIIGARRESGRKQRPGRGKIAGRETPGEVEISFANQNSCRQVRQDGATRRIRRGF